VSTERPPAPLRRSTRSLAFRLAASAALWSAGVLLVGGLVLAGLFRDSVERAFEARLEVHLVSLVAASEVDEDGRVTLARADGEPRFEQPFSGWYWQVEGGDTLLRSRSLWDERLGGLEPGVAAVPGPAGQSLRVLARTITLPERDAPLLFAVAGDSAEITLEVTRFNRILFWALGLLLAGLLVAVLVQVRFGLAPLNRLRGELAAIRAGRLERLDERLPTELAPVARELNALLAHNALIVSRARTHVGNLAHALKTPLSVLRNEAERDERVPAELVRRQAEAMQRQVDHHLVRARAAAAAGVLGVRTELAPVVDDLVRTLARIHGRSGIDIEADCPAGLHFQGERQDLEEMLGNLLDNACKWGRTLARITAADEGERVVVLVDDDGAGLPDEARREVPTRGTRLDETTPGSGLGLSIVRDLAELYGGTLELERSPEGGLRARLALPAATG
jgi:signal transduction histidine kinase